MLRRERKGILGRLGVRNREEGAGRPVALGVSEVRNCAAGLEGTLVPASCRTSRLSF